MKFLANLNSNFAVKITGRKYEMVIRNRRQKKKIQKKKNRHCWMKYDVSNAITKIKLLI